MTNQITISLSSLRFFSHHGLYAEEKKTGNEFEVALSVAYTPLEGIITDIAATINYEQLYALVKRQMQVPRGLLETLAMEIAGSVYTAFPGINSVDISITKLHAPIVALTGQVGVRYYREF